MQAAAAPPGNPPGNPPNNPPGGVADVASVKEPDGVRLAWAGTSKAAAAMTLADAPACLATLGLAGLWRGAERRAQQWPRLTLFGATCCWHGSGRERARRWAIGAAVTAGLMLLAYGAASAVILATGSERFWLADLAVLAVLLPAWRLDRHAVVLHVLAHSRLGGKTVRLADPAAAALSRDLLLGLAVLATAGLVWPWAAVHRLHQRLNRIWIGDLKLSVAPFGSMRLYLTFLPVWLAAVLTGGLLFQAVEPGLTRAMAQLARLDDPLAPIGAGAVLAAAFAAGWPALVGFLLWLWLLTGALGAWRGRLWRAAAAATAIGGYRFRVRPLPAATALVAMIAPVLVLMTAGAARPLVRHVWLRLAADRVSGWRADDARPTPTGLDPDRPRPRPAPTPTGPDPDRPRPRPAPTPPARSGLDGREPPLATRGAGRVIP